MSISKIRTILYSVAKYLGDFNAKKERFNQEILSLLLIELLEEFMDILQVEGCQDNDI